tara:strand:+ start:2548 stop:2670 length:123 start_codon:yes stop_codon:yes gene_type:complete
MGEMEGLLDRYWVSTTVMVVVMEGILEVSFVCLDSTPLAG